ncbi:hypothetical protein NKJ04_17695 [Mesorhizobium sp. M0618]|uniref:hypothetical protein n=1 Tax=Mesorhizobium sp. M0618 TaxID=2956972 RepID=UPI003337E582
MWINLDPQELELIKVTLKQGGNHPAFTNLIDKLVEWEKDSRSPLHKHFNEIAFENYEDEGNLEIDRQGDETAMVSISEDDGAYVLAWQWVSNDEADICTECGDHPGSETYGTVGDGYDGLCPSCADKAEEEDDDGEEENT